MCHKREVGETILDFCKRLVGYDCRWVNVGCMTKFNVIYCEKEMEYCREHIDEDPHYRYIYHCLNGVEISHDTSRFDFVAERLKLLLLCKDANIHAPCFIHWVFDNFQLNYMAVIFLISICVLHHSFTRALSDIKNTSNNVKHAVIENILNIVSLIDIEEIENLETVIIVDAVKDVIFRNEHVSELIDNVRRACKRKLFLKIGYF